MYAARMVDVVMAAALPMLLVWGMGVHADDQPHRRSSRPVDSMSVHSAPPGKTRDETWREVWDLSLGEADRFNRLMQGPRGAFSQPNISPLEVLGIHARTAEDRRRYAERVVRMMYEDTERVLAFQREVDEAWKRLYPGVPMFRVEDLPESGQPFDARDRLAGQRLAAFVSTACMACQAVMPTLLSLADGPAAGLDLYVVDSLGEDARIRDWAREVGINPKSVADGRITLNHDHGTLERIGGRRSVPQVFVREEGGLVPLALPALARQSGGDAQ